MTVLFITGLSGTGKSTLLDELKLRGYHVVDTDYGYIQEVDGEVILDEDKITRLLEEYRDSHLFIAGIYSNQGKFYERFDRVILLKAELEVMLDRIQNRTSNPYGKHPEEIAKVIASYRYVLPLLEARADIIIDTSNNGVDSICKKLLDIL